MCVLPVVFRCVFEQLAQLKRVFADLLHRREQEASDGDVDHLLQEATGLEEVLIASLLHQSLQLCARRRVCVTVLRVYGETFTLTEKDRMCECEDEQCE